MQKMVQIQSIAAGLSVRKILRRVMQACERNALRSRILRRVQFRRTTLGVVKQHRGTRALRHRRCTKQRASTARDRGRNRYAGRIQIGEKPGFGSDVGVATAAPA
jgi:hypothetical protein